VNKWIVVVVVYVINLLVTMITWWPQ